MFVGYIDKLCAIKISSLMKVGDWVNSYSKGIWQILRIDEVENELEQHATQTIVHCKRFLNSSYKKSFSAESCSNYFITKISESELERVNEIIELNNKWYEEFLNYHKFVDSIYNLSLHVSNSTEREIFKKSIVEKCKSVNSGFSKNIINQLLSSELENNKKSTIRNFTAQFISINSEIKDRQLIYREVRFLDF